MTKKRILIVTSSLQAAGAEKYAFELAKSFDKRNFDVELLTTNDVYSNKTFPHIYFPILKSLGFKIHTIFNKPKEWVIGVPKFITRNFFLLKLFNYPFFIVNKWRIDILYQQKLKNLFKKFDAILLIDALHYRKFKDYLPEDIYIETHLMCHQVQFGKSFDIYEGYSRTGKNNFVYIDAIQLQEIRNKNIAVQNSFYFPLSLEIPQINKNSTVLYNRIHSQKNIAVFTRISSMKPLEKIIDSFELLWQLDSTVHLKLFGFIQDLEYYKTLIKLIKVKGLVKNISFEGHSTDMMGSINKHDILLLWVPAIYNFVGYAATEVCLHRVPIILNNVEKSCETLALDDAESIPPYFYSEQGLAQFTFSVLQNERDLEKLRDKEYEYYVDNNNIINNIKKYQDYLQLKLI
ncbi:MAG: glycosyltransferase [Flavobacteriaceae bacterium]|nr:glycosyltransferase [Flavobacteriaceae bacterium]